MVGGANSAGQAALLLSRYARTVRILVRGPSLSTSMSRYLIDRIEAQDNMEVLTHSEIVAVSGARRLESLTIRDSRDGGTREIETSHVFIFIGSRPRSEMLEGVVELDENGFIRTGPDLLSDGRRPAGWPLARDPFLLEASIPGVFAAGDVRSGSTKRVASAVGEGSSVVGMIHKYLESV